MNLKQRLAQLADKVNSLSFRERVLIFLAAAFLLVSLVDALFLTPLLNQQKQLSAQILQQQEQMKAVQAQLTALVRAREADASSPQRERIRLLREQIAQGESYMKQRRDKLVPPAHMAALLEQMLNRNTHLQLVAMETLPVTPFIESVNEEGGVSAGSLERQIYKHGVKLVVRGSYADLTQYMLALEKLPTQMFWGLAKMTVPEHPVAELTLELYTLSLDKTWIQV